MSDSREYPEASCNNSLYYIVYSSDNDSQTLPITDQMAEDMLKELISNHSRYGGLSIFKNGYIFRIIHFDNVKIATIRLLSDCWVP